VAPDRPEVADAGGFAAPLDGAADGATAPVAFVVALPPPVPLPPVAPPPAALPLASPPTAAEAGA
jgi:hypothetical protein